MSAAAIRAYVPRTGSLPPATSPNPQAKRQAYWPRSSRNPSPNTTEEARRSADAILKLLGSLPAPLTGSLSSTLRAKPSPQGSPTSSSSFPSFKAYARAQKRKASSDADSNVNGLGLLGATKPASRPPLKKARTSDILPGSSSSSSTAMTPPQRISHLSSPKARSSLRNEITTRSNSTGTAEWTREQWGALFSDLGRRAHALKRLGEALLHPAAAKGHLQGRVSEDAVRGALTMTDSFCLYMFRNFCEDRMHSKINSAAYLSLEALRAFILGAWKKLSAHPEHRDMARGMIGLLHLMEAVVHDHVATSELRVLGLMGKDIQNNLPASSAGSAHGPSPSSSSESPGPALARSPASSAHSEISADMLRLLRLTSTSSATAAKALRAARHYLSVRTLRTLFPTTWHRALESDLSEEVTSDGMGSARFLDIDEPDTFAWPIEMGLQDAVAHVAVFGRSLVREFSQVAGKPWSAVSSEADSPEGARS